nr:magnesium transporter [Cryptococcus depauperatus CBS 7841]
MPDRLSSSPRQIIIDPNVTQPSRSMSTTSSNALTPSKNMGTGSFSHRGSRNYRLVDLDEEDARRRQTQQDIESAISMSRARSGSMNPADNSPPIVRPSQMHIPSSPIRETGFAMLPNEEDRLHKNRAGEGCVRRDSEGENNGYDSQSRLIRRGSENDIHQMTHTQHVDFRSLGSHGLRNVFDFKAMDEFAKQEREELSVVAGAWPIDQKDGSRRSMSNKLAAAGEENLNQPESYDTTLDRTTNNMSGFGDESEAPFSPERRNGDHNQNLHRRRKRKLSQSNPVLHQKKLALFESFGANRGVGTNGDDMTEQPSTAFKAPRHQNNTGFAPYTDAAPGHDRPYRFSFYSNALPVTIHAKSLSELPAEGQSFEDLFRGKSNIDNAVFVNDSASRTEGSETPVRTATTVEPSTMQSTKTNPSLLTKAVGAAMGQQSGGGTNGGSMDADDDPEQNTWWLDVLSPTDEEMRMLSKAFGIHPLTTEDILLEETREKIELFRNYYLVCFRSFDQDCYSQTYLEPLNMYIIVFREGTLSFHFRGTPHPQRVRRRIKHLKDYISVTSDWISYALIDDITDAFGPLIQSIEFEVDSIDELVLILKEAEQSDMLRRIGTCRKKVMGLLRLMGNKADVVKGLAKRCNEQWLVAPKSDIGLYLSDIQDHLITMTQNLNHYEKILSRSHSNYLAQISIEMTDANNQINDVLSKLTALGTVLIPMNLVTGLWGMNVHVPGEDIKVGYSWFGGILGCLCLFAMFGAWATVSTFSVSI